MGLRNRKILVAFCSTEKKSASGSFQATARNRKRERKIHKNTRRRQKEE